MKLEIGRRYKNKMGQAVIILPVPDGLNPMPLFPFYGVIETTRNNESPTYNTFKSNGDVGSMAHNLDLIEELSPKLEIGRKYRVRDGSVKEICLPPHPYRTPPPGQFFGKDKNDRWNFFTENGQPTNDTDSKFALIAEAFDGQEFIPTPVKTSLPTLYTKQNSAYPWGGWVMKGGAL